MMVTGAMRYGARTSLARHGLPRWRPAPMRAWTTPATTAVPRIGPMRWAYLEAMDRLAASYRAVGPVMPPPRVLAALGPKMLALAAERAQGAHPYLVPPEHTAKAREQLGRDRWILPEQGVVLETNPTNARAIARRHLAPYLCLPTTSTTCAGSGSPTTTWSRAAVIVWSMPRAPAFCEVVWLVTQFRMVGAGMNVQGMRLPHHHDRDGHACRPRRHAQSCRAHPDALTRPRWPGRLDGRWCGA
jgi:hypothetical protein